MLDDAIATKIGPKLALIAKFLEGKKYVCGDYVTAADLTLWIIVRTLDALNATEVQKHKKELYGFVDDFRDIPELKEYLKSSRNDKKPMFPAFASINASWWGYQCIY